MKCFKEEEEEEERRARSLELLNCFQGWMDG
jgi:hypothetical protein